MNVEKEMKQNEFALRMLFVLSIVLGILIIFKLLT